MTVFLEALNGFVQEFLPPLWNWSSKHPVPFCDPIPKWFAWDLMTYTSCITLDHFMIIYMQHHLMPSLFRRSRSCCEASRKDNGIFDHMIGVRTPHRCSWDCEIYAGHWLSNDPLRILKVSIGRKQATNSPHSQAHGDNKKVGVESHKHQLHLQLTLAVTCHMGSQTGATAPV